MRRTPSVVGFAYFLFTGVPVKRIYKYAGLVATEHPGIDFVRIALRKRMGQALMHCQMCKHREQVLQYYHPYPHADRPQGRLP